MSRFLNNFCEDLVNGSNPRYCYSQPTLAQQIAFKQQKEQEEAARQKHMKDMIRSEIEWKEKNGYYVSNMYKNGV